MEHIKNQLFALLIVGILVMAAYAAASDTLGIKSYNHARATAVVMDAETVAMTNEMEQDRANRQQAIDTLHQPVEDAKDFAQISSTVLMAFCCGGSFVVVALVGGLFFGVRDVHEIVNGE